MKIIKHFVLTVLVAFVGNISAFAYDFEVDGIFYNTLSLQDLTCEVTYNDYSSSYSGDVVIPFSVTYAGKTFKVTAIGEHAFSSRSSLTSIMIPYSVTAIGSYAFRNCYNLTSIEVPNSATTIGEYAFSNCSSLTSINIPNSATVIGRNAFNGCSSLTSIKIPNSVTEIGYGVFYGCSSLTSIEIPNSVISIGGYAFYGCSSLTSIALPNSITSIDSNAFYGCSSLTSIALPNSVTSIGSYAFSGCSSLTSPVYNATLFAYCPPSIDGEFTVPNGIEEICPEAFYGCDQLRVIRLPNSLKRIRVAAFLGASITSINIPSSVEQIESEAFNSCNNLNAVNIENLSSWMKINFLDNPLNSGSGNLYLSGLLLENMVVPSDITEIGRYVFAGAKCLKNLKLTNNVTTIDKFAFANCTGISKVEIPASVTKLDKCAFDGCKALVDFNVDSDNPTYSVHNGMLLTKDKKTILKAIVDVEDFEFPETVTAIADSAFISCVRPTTLEIPDRITSIGKFAFYRCNGLVSAKLGYGIEELSPGVFSYCNNLESITLLSALKIIGDGALQCQKLTAIEIPSTVTKIGNYAFSSSGLTSVVLPERLEEIGERAFRSCNNLTSIVVPDKVKTIGREAFSNCKELKSTILGDGLEKISLDIFSKCKNLTTVSFGRNVNEIVWSGDSWNFNLTLTDIHVKDIAAWCKVKSDIQLSSKEYDLYEGNKLITQLEIPADVTEISAYLFANCKSINSVSVPKSCKSFGSDAFYQCKNIKSVNIEDLSAWCNIKFENSFSCPKGYSYGTSLYLNGNLVKNLIVPSDVIEISDYCFNFFTFSSITIPDNVEKIGRDAFFCCPYVSTIRIGSGLKTIGRDAFYVTNPKSVYIKDLSAWCKVDILDEYEYAHSNPLEGADLYIDNKIVTNLDIPTDITEIKPYTFKGCNSIKLISLHNAVTQIGNGAFADCKNITKVISLNTTPPRLEEGSFGDYVKSQCILQVQDTALPFYQQAEYWKDFWLLTGGAVDTKIDNIWMEGHSGNGIMHNMQGIPVNDSYKGVVIINGKKMILK